MSIDKDHFPKTDEQISDSEGNPVPPLDVRSPQPNFGDDAQGERIRQANRSVAEKSSHWGKRIMAGVAAAAVFSAGSYVAVKAFGGDKDPNAGKGESTSANKKPGTLSVKERVEQMTADQQYAELDKVHGPATPLQIEIAKTVPIIGETPKEVVEEGGKLYNVLYNSGKTDTSTASGESTITDKSKVDGNDILKNITGPNYDHFANDPTLSRAIVVMAGFTIAYPGEGRIFSTADAAIDSTVSQTENGFSVDVVTKTTDTNPNENLDLNTTRKYNEVWGKVGGRYYLVDITHIE